jgi:uncharacterized protein (TIGR03083 family)
MDHRMHCDLLEAEIPNVDRAFRGAAPDAVVPSCPDWTVAELARHLGGVHRWADHLVSTTAQERDRAPKDPTRPGADGSADDWADWLSAGLVHLVATLRAADAATTMWTWGDGTDVAWWTRRQLHETVVHRIDAELAAGTEWTVDPAVAVDAVDEHLGNILASGSFSEGVANLKGEGSLHLHATDTEGEWMIELTPTGFEISHEHGKGTVAARGPAGALLAAVTNRGGIEPLEVFGDAELLRWWITNSALQ